jgi:hypothetical protein
MKLRLGMIAALTASAAAGHALAGSACTPPKAPAPVDGRTATGDQLMASKDAVLAFMDASDTYQTCVLGELNNARAAAALNKTEVPATVADEAEGLVSANQGEKEKVGAAFNDSVRTYNAAHPH